MDETSDLVERADSLMRSRGAPFVGRRRRSFLAAPESAAAAASPPPASEDDDIPVLTDVVPADAAVAEHAPERVDEIPPSIAAPDFMHSVELRLASELPALIEATLSNARNELRAGINVILEAAWNDFLARRQQLPLPLDEPKSDAQQPPAG
jgi:hypothetical protein